MAAGKFYVLFNYFKDLLRYNLPISFLIALVGHATGSNFFTSFIAALVTGGYVLASYLYWRMSKQEYYFYYNKGFSWIGLTAYSWLLNGLLASLIIIVKSIIR
jgi:hypothetical protein